MQSNNFNLPTPTLPAAIFAPPCEQCGHPMHMLGMHYGARGQVLKYHCVVCTWRTSRKAKSPATLQG